MPKRKTWTGRVYIGRDPETGKQLFDWVGRFDTKRERDAAVAERRRELGEAKPDLPTVEAEVAAYLEWYGKHHPKSLRQITERLKRFREDFAAECVDIPRDEIKDWAAGKGKWKGRGPIPNGYLAGVRSFFTFVIDEQDRPIGKNPARKLAETGIGRAKTAPPTEDEFVVLLEATAALGPKYAPTMRAMFEFAAFTLMRPGELYELKWTDIDFKRNRIAKDRRVYRGEVAEPKTGPKVIALTPPARDAILNLPRTSEYVFPAKTGGRMYASGHSGYWGKVLARAGLEFEWYLASKHYGVWYLWTKVGLSKRAIAAQAGWEESTVDKMLKVYGHGEVGALDEIDAAFAEHVPALRALKGGKAS
jgi:integrase